MDWQITTSRFLIEITYLLNTYSISNLCILLIIFFTAVIITTSKITTTVITNTTTITTAIIRMTIPATFVR